MYHPSTAEFVKAEASLTGAPEPDKALLNFENCEGWPSWGAVQRRSTDPDWFDITNLHGSAYGGDESDEIAESLIPRRKIR
jgi:hypothetical protein